MTELVLRDAAHAVDTIDDLDEAEVFASGTVELFRPLGLPPAPVVSPREVLTAARRASDTAAAVMAEVMAIYGPFETRVRSRELATELADSGVGLPAVWDRLGRVEPVRVAMMADVWGDGFSLYVDCVRDGERIGAGVTIDTIGGVLAGDFLYGPVIETVEELAADDEHTWVVDIDWADARATVELALDERDQTIDLDEGDADPNDELRALVEHRFSLLPGGGRPLQEYRDVEEVRDELIAAFLDGAGHALRGDAEDIAGTICDYAGYCDGDPLCWSPSRVQAFLGAWVPAKVVADDEWFRNLPVVLRDWLRFAAERRALPAAALEINLAAVDAAMGLMQENRRDPAAASPATAMVREMLDEGIDVTDEVAVQAWIDRYNARPRHERY